MLDPVLPGVPAASSEPVRRRGAASVKPSSSSRGDAGVSVLVVEDDDAQRALALLRLRRAGIGVALEAADGEAALNLLGDRVEPVDVVLVDLGLPGMDGIELIGRIVQRDLARAVVVLSALDPALLNTVRVMAQAAGMRVLGALEKPLTQAKLNSIISRYHTGAADAEAGEIPALDKHLLEEALHRDAFEAWFQPQVDIHSGVCIGVEALARWNLDGRPISPVCFIPALERYGLIDALTERVLAQTCDWLGRWQKAGLALGASVNISMHSLEDIGAADRYQASVRAAGIDPRCITLEITESAVMQDVARVLNVLARLRLKGFGLSVDDFGTGWSSLSQLARMPVTELKIDQGFVSNFTRDARARAVVEASLELGRKLRLVTVAEGVRSTAEWQRLAKLGCARAQGELFGMAVPGDRVQWVSAARARLARRS